MKFIWMLPHVDASLNTISSLFLLLGFYFIRRKQIFLHRICMVTAFAASTLFLICYLTYHTLLVYYLGQGPTHFKGTGMVRTLYFAILSTHTVLAALVAPLAIITILYALRGRFDRHRKIARWTLPIWLYVSVTGVVVYLLLYHIYPAR